MIVKSETWKERMGTRLRAVLVYLSEHGGVAKRDDILDFVGGLMPLTENEQEVDSTGTVKWRRDTQWYTTNLVKSGWVTKDGWGTWSLTDGGRRSLEEYPDPVDHYDEAKRRYKAWTQATKRRAWLVKGNSVQGVNLVPAWLNDEFCSLAAAQLGPLPETVDVRAVRTQAEDDYGHLHASERAEVVDAFVAFVARMKDGDLVVASSDGNVYVGDVAGGWTQEEGGSGRTNLRRDVTWRNADSPVDFGSIPGALAAKFATGGDIVELTEYLSVLDGLGAEKPTDELDDDELVPHEHLPRPSQTLADELDVDTVWLNEVRDVLDERRQLVFYGPPGTGKTFIARKLAADLVGPEQVRLVQFHPAYTYEDFFEGYRPTPGATEGTISFELRAGPFRKVVNRARQHPDLAYVLIIDEINRANLAKVFGELYFLLEYRDQAIDLLYSADEQGFTMPPNIYVIGTMNTADRSIALLDQAMRRRFAFVELSPDAEPTRSLLRRWSQHHGLGDSAADLLDALNARIDDPDFRIGPSYFMRSTAPDSHSRERLERIWDTSISPLLQEHHYGEWGRVKGRYALGSLLPATPDEATLLEGDEPAAGE